MIEQQIARMQTHPDEPYVILSERSESKDPCPL